MRTGVIGKAVWADVARAWPGLLRVIALSGVIGSATLASAQTGAAVPAGLPEASSATLPSGFVIGPDDVLSIVFWREKDMSAEVVVRPDGKVSLPLLNELPAAGSTPEELRVAIEKAATKYVAEPNVTVIVKTINSRKVHILGSVGKAGTYPLTGEMNVLQLIAMAGGLQEYADAKHIVVMRKEDEKNRTLKFNYKDVVNQKNLEQNVSLKPGDTVIVP